MAVNENALVVASINDYPEQKFNRLFPCTLTQLSPLHKVMVNIVQIDPNPDNGDVYPQKEGGKLSLTKTGCLKLMTAANVIMEESKPILPKACQRCVQVAQMTKTAPQCGNCSTKEDAAFQVSILVPEPSGGHRRYIGSKEISKQLFKAAVEHMGAQCETKALLRALRAGLGIKGQYSKSELQKPFAVALVVLNTTDPELKAALIQRYAAGERALFGAPQSLALPGSNVQALPGGQAIETVAADEFDDDDYDDYPEVVQNDEQPPWETDGGQAPDFIICDGCHQVIAGNGNWTPEAIRDYSVRKFNKVLCPDCQKEVRPPARGGARR